MKNVYCSWRTDETETVNLLTVIDAFLGDKLPVPSNEVKQVDIAPSDGLIQVVYEENSHLEVRRFEFSVRDRG